jgi:trehalose 6-phosphate synthase
VVREQLSDCAMVVVSNREPYVHGHDREGRINVQVPASGMVTAIEPIMRACSGTWIAHGSGAADREVVDRNDRVRVPPEDPSYTLRRVWLTEEQEQGYYYGFANEGLWPLCHLAYVRPAFRESDWHHYQAVNAKFADAVAAEIGKSEAVILVQDFHFALLPKLIRDRGVKATTALFWHIPWPNAETIGVCPWKKDILLAMLQADILGFHTLYHCQNFLATLDRFVECQVDYERMAVTHQGHVCHVTAYPISIEWPPHWLAKVAPAPQAQATIRQRFGLAPGVRIGLGVERWDFTKGIIERFLALETLFDKHPRWRGRLTFLQVAAPSRSKLPAYQALQQQTLSELERINGRFANGGWQPIVLIAEHQEPAQVFELFRAADFALVNSLHDGMNLVAKEFVAARDDEDGVLVLSTFAGASRELPEALLVNPYDLGETAAAIGAALDMPREERRKRMQLMRRTVAEYNVYRWAGRMLMDVARNRQRRQLESWSGQ